MLLEIDDYKTVGDLQDKFSECFPHLRIHFFKKSHHWQEENVDEKILPDVKVGDIRKRHDPGILQISSTDKAGAVEKAFKHQFDLNVQIFYQKNDQWIQTEEKDITTLKDLQ